MQHDTTSGTELPRPEPRAGHVIWFPPGATWMNRDKPRPFVAAATPDVPRTATLAYGSTQQSEEVSGARCVRVAPQRHGINRNGLREHTLFYPGILLREDYAFLPAPAGTLGKSMGPFRSALRAALGIGTGSCLTAGAPAGSRRGQIVELRRSLARDVRTRYAIVLTEPGYSRARHYDVILPLLVGDGRLASDTILRVAQREWFEVFGHRPRSVLLPIPVVQSTWYEADIIGETPHVVDDETLTDIDVALRSFFSLPYD